jgi:hypothetical protein
MPSRGADGDALLRELSGYEAQLARARAGGAFGDV